MPRANGKLSESSKDITLQRSMPRLAEVKPRDVSMSGNLPRPATVNSLQRNVQRQQSFIQPKRSQTINRTPIPRRSQSVRRNSTITGPKPVAAVQSIGDVNIFNDKPQYPFLDSPSETLSKPSVRICTNSKASSSSKYSSRSALVGLYVPKFTGSGSKLNTKTDSPIATSNKTAKGDTAIKKARICLVFNKDRGVNRRVFKPKSIASSVVTPSEHRPVVYSVMDLPSTITDPSLKLWRML
jgi:hypothetical protein